MLSRTADQIYWLSRYVERAENMARLIDMARRMAAVPGDGPDCDRGHRSEWPSVLSAAGAAKAFEARRRDPDMAGLSPTAAIQRFLLLDTGFPGSVASSFEAARANARAARGALTREMWESVNDAWIQMRALRPEDLSNGSLSPVLDWVKLSGAQFRGAADGSALRNDGFDFLRLGFFVERLDNTARLLDVKSFSAPWSATIGGADGRTARDAAIDHYQWVAILRAAGLLLAYRAQYRSDYDPEKMADFLIQNAQCPRSLMHCALRVEEHVNTLAANYGRRVLCSEDARALTNAVRDAEIDLSDPASLHGFLSDIVRRSNALSESIALSFYFAPQSPKEDLVEAQAEATDDGIEAAGRLVTPADQAAPPTSEAPAVAMMAQQQASGRRSGDEAAREMSPRGLKAAFAAPNVD